jgi:hypothetical protein
VYNIGINIYIVYTACPVPLYIYMAALCNYLVFGICKLLSQLIPNFGKSSALIWKQRNLKILYLYLRSLNDTPAKAKSSMIHSSLKLDYEIKQL